MRDAPFVIVGNLTDRPRLKRSQPVAFDDFHRVNVSTLSCGWRHLWLMDAQSQFAALFHRGCSTGERSRSDSQIAAAFPTVSQHLCEFDLWAAPPAIGPKDTAFNYKTFSCIPLKGHWDHRRSAFMVGILLDGVAAQVIHSDVTIFKRVPFLLGRSLGGSPSTGCRYRVRP
jgi:hypothetical protein